MTAVVGKKAPDFNLPATGDKTLRLSSLQGKQVILYFYPKDSTPGCTLEGQNFRDQQKKIRQNQHRHHRYLTR